jgi:hypothetical protein
MSDNKIKKNSWGRLLLVAGFAGLFAFGIVVGAFLWGGEKSKTISMSEAQCGDLSREIVNAGRNTQYYGDPATQKQSWEFHIQKLRELNDIYTKNCAGREVNVENPKPATKSESKPLPTKTCEAIEELLEDRIYTENLGDAGYHLSNAQIYMNLAERGCPENSENYKQLAQREIEIMRALENDYLVDYELKSVVDIYRKLEMKAEAAKVFEKVKKMTDPAIDFILEVEKIINE